MKLSECKGQSFLIDGKIVSYQNVLKMIYEGKLFGPISLANIDTKYAKDLSGVMSQMSGQNEKDKSLNLLQTEIIEIDISRNDIKPLNATNTMFVVDKKDPSLIPLSECIEGEYAFMSDTGPIDLMDILEMIYNKQELPIIQAVQMDMMYSHEYSAAMQKLYMNPDEVQTNNYELSLLKTKTVVIDISPEQIEKVSGYEGAYTLKAKEIPVETLPVTPTAPVIPVETHEIIPEQTATTDILAQHPGAINTTANPTDGRIYGTLPETTQIPPNTTGNTATGMNGSHATGYTYADANPNGNPTLSTEATQTTGQNTQESYTAPGASPNNVSAPVATQVQLEQSEIKKVPEQNVPEHPKRFQGDVKEGNNYHSYTNEEKKIPKRRNKTLKKIWRGFTSIFGWLINVALIVIAFYIVTTHLVINAEIPSESMEPTVLVGDRIIGNRLTFTLERAERGDIAIFKNPDNPDELYIKRIIGLPGETVTIKSGKIYIDDFSEPLEEPYLNEEWTVKNDGLVYEVPEGHYFMLGDNRNVSYDARYWENTFVPQEYMVAEAVFRYFPINSISILNEDQDNYYQNLTNAVDNLLEGQLE